MDIINNLPKAPIYGLEPYITSHKTRGYILHFCCWFEDADKCMDIFKAYIKSLDLHIVLSEYEDVPYNYVTSGYIWFFGDER